MSLVFDDLQNQMKQIISVPTSSIKQGSNIRVVPDINSRNAINAFKGLKVLVLDASDDTTVGSGAASYIYDGSEWVKVSEVESLEADAIISSTVSSLTLADLGYDAGLKKFEASPALGAADAILASTGLAELEETVITEGLNDPDVPRILTVTGNLSSVAGNVVIEGTNANDEVISETIVANGTSTVEGTKAFKTVTSVTLPVYVDAADTISVGTGDKLGIGQIVTIGLPVYASVNGNKESTDPVITTSATMEENLIEFSTALSGVPVLCYFID